MDYKFIEYIIGLFIYVVFLALISFNYDTLAFLCAFSACLGTMLISHSAFNRNKKDN